MDDRICRPCNNTRLGILDEQVTRCGPEAFFRRLYGVVGRSEHNEVNPFYRPSAGGARLEMRAYDAQLGCEILIECDNGAYRQQTQIVFIEPSGRTRHLPIRPNDSPERLRGAFNLLQIPPPFEARILYGPEDVEWVERLIADTWPAATFEGSSLTDSDYRGATVNVGLTDRYFRGVAKIGFHYFLTQFSQYAGHELCFSDIRKYIFEDGTPVDTANDFVGIRQNPLLGNMLNPNVRPDGWRGHLLCAEIRPSECLTHLQLFLSEDWQAPVYTVRLAHGSAISECSTSGHIYYYYPDGPRGRFSGEVIALDVSRTDTPPPPVSPVIRNRN